MLWLFHLEPGVCTSVIHIHIYTLQYRANHVVYLTMAAILGAVRRNWLLMNPPVATKQDDALKIGILGAASIAPLAVIIPAISHPEVIIQAVAARDNARATEYAKKHGIPDVHNSYDGRSLWWQSSLTFVRPDR